MSYTDGPVVIVKDSDLASDMVVTVPGIKPVMADMQSMFCLRRTALELMDAYNVNAEIQANDNEDAYKMPTRYRTSR